MKNYQLETERQNRANRSLFITLAISFLGSTVVHAAAMFSPVPTLWNAVESENDDAVEVVVVNPEKEINAEPGLKVEERIADIPKEPAVTDRAIENIDPEPSPPAIALAPVSDKPLPIGRDAPAPDNFKPLTTSGIGEYKIQQGGGKIISEGGKGSGFGNAKVPTGFFPGGVSEGDPDGVSNGKVGGVVNGKEGEQGTGITKIIEQLIPTPFQPEPTESPKSTPKLECLSCPKPQYRGKEGTPRVTYDIAADGKVTNVRLRKSSGDAETDRETMEVMSKWQFNPRTLPEGGRTNVKVRVTFEEAGSQFQRQNEENRRNREVEQQRIADQEREVQRAKPSLIAPKPAPTVNNPVVNEKVAPAPVVAPPVPVYVPPEPIYVAPSPLYVPPEPIYIPPGPVYVAPAELPPPPSDSPQ